MKKRILAMIMLVTLAFTVLTACGSNEDDNSSNSSNGQLEEDATKNETNSPVDATTDAYQKYQNFMNKNGYTQCILIKMDFSEVPVAIFKKVETDTSYEAVVYSDGELNSDKGIAVMYLHEGKLLIDKKESDGTVKCYMYNIENGRFVVERTYTVIGTDENGQEIVSDGEKEYIGIEFLRALAETGDWRFMPYENENWDVSIEEATRRIWD